MKNDIRDGIQEIFVESDEYVNRVRNKFPDSDIITFYALIDNDGKFNCKHYAVKPPLIDEEPVCFNYLISIPEGSRLEEIKPGLFAIVKNDDN